MKTMRVAIRRSELVPPASHTPHTTLPNSNIDLMVPPVHIPRISFYKPHPNLGLFSWEALKEALAKALVPFYPLAGRLRLGYEDGRLEINCNGEGALLVEATADACIADFGDFAPDPVFQQLIPKADYTQDVSTYPVLLLQITFFKCGGASLCIGTQHNVADGTSAMNFINTWAGMARGESHLRIDTPFLDRTLLKPRSPPTPRFPHIEYKPPPSLLNPTLEKEKCEPSSANSIEAPSNGLALKMEAKMEGLLPLNDASSNGTPAAATAAIVGSKDAIISQEFPPPISIGVFKFTKDHLQRLKSQAEDGDNLFTYSSFEMLSGHLWRSVCKVRRLVDDQDTKLYIATDGRSRLRPPLPQGYFGNAIFTATPMAKVGDLLSKPLHYAASRIHKAVAGMDDEYLRSALDFLELQPDLTKLTRGPHTFRSPNFGMSSWAKLPLYDADFGWGRPIFAGPAMIPIEGLAYVLPSATDDGSLTIALSLQADHMPSFEKIIWEI